VRKLAALIMLAASAGCATASTSRTVAQSVESATPGCRLERDSTLVLGPASLTLVRALSGVAGDDLDEDTREMLRSVRRIEICTYRATPRCGLAGMPPLLARQLAADGWHAVVATVDDEGELSWILTRSGDGGAISGLLVIAFDHDELEVVRLDGEIDRLLVAAVEEDPESVRELVDRER
jgi:hypothetical protein